MLSNNKDLESQEELLPSTSSSMNGKQKSLIVAEDVPFTKSWFSFEFGVYLTVVAVAYFGLVKTMFDISSQWANSISLRNSWLGPMDTPWSRAQVQLGFGMVFAATLHRSQFLWLLVLLAVYHSVVRGLLHWVPVRRRVLAVQLFSWAFGLAVLFQAHLKPRLMFFSNWLGSDYFQYDFQMHNWVLTWNFLMLKSISFSMDWVWMSVQAPGRRLSPHHQLACGLCRQGQLCLARRIRDHQPAEFYGLGYFLAYAFYAPLYVAGPTMTFNSFVSQLQTPQLAYSNGRQLLYAMRWAGCLLLMEVMARYFYCWALRDSRIFSVTVNTSQLCVVAYWSLVLLWVKFTVIWRFFRCWSLLAGIEPPENMTRCMNNNYTMQGFWRGWHASFNAWLVRYLYIPLGGSKYKFLNLWVIFLFVAVWHEIELRLLYWAVFVCILFLPELTVSLVMHSQRVQLSAWWQRWRASFAYRLACAVCASASIMLMMSVNLVGFFVGRTGVLRLLRQLLFDAESRPFLAISFVALSSAAMLMFKIRVNEKMAIEQQSASKK